MSVIAPAPARTGPAPESPYVGLVPFGEEDAGFFFGRSQEIAIVSANLRSARLTIVYGPSGVGKSSLLQAGVVHGLREQARAGDSDAPFAVCTVRSWHDDPKQRLLQAASDALGDGLPSATGTLAEPLRVWTANTRTLLVVLDQFEEYFQYHEGEAEGEELTGFAAELAEVVNDPTLAVHVLISIREDAWAKLDRFEGHVPLLFANYLRVDHLDVDSAREAIEGPIAAWNLLHAPMRVPYHVEPELVDAVIAAAAAGLGLDGDDATAPRAFAGDRVEAPFLQLVLERLWRATVADGEYVLTRARLEALGGARKIVENHLVEALARLSGKEQDVASDCFRFLVSRSKTKIAHPAADLAEWTRRSEPVVTAVLDRLTSGESGRILRAVAPPLDRAAGPSYELFHDVLAEPILAWRLAHERERSRRAAQRRLLRVGGAALALVAVFAALGIWALVERGHANDARHAVEAQNVSLRKQRDRLAATVQKNKDTGNARQTTIDKLTATSNTLREQTLRLRKNRNALDGRIAKLRSQNTRLSTAITRLNTQNRSLAARATTLRRSSETLKVRLGVLVNAHDSLAANAGTLRTEAAVLASQQKAADRREGELLAKAAALGYHPVRVKAPFQTSVPVAKPIPPERATHYGIPAALAETDALRGEVERLQRELAALLEQRARQADEITFLHKLNGLLVRQRRALRREIDHLSGTRAALESRQRTLEQTLSSAEGEHARLSGLVATAKAAHTKRRKDVAAQTNANVRLQNRNNTRIEGIAEARFEFDQTRDRIRSLVNVISSPVKKLTRGAQDTTQDVTLAALLATAAYQVTPFSPDDAAHPTVYNALWVVLSRLDPSGARDLITPVASPNGKVGTTTSAMLRTRVCAFVKRGFTPDEWRAWLPAAAPYPSKLSNPCG